MKSKKLISFLCAAAMTASTFASLAVTASAATEADILWSDTFNNAAAGVIADGTNGTVTNSDAVKGLTFVTTNRGSGDKASYTDSNGNYVLSGSYYAVMGDKADTADKYLRMSFPHFGDFGQNGRWAHVDLGSGYAATAEKDVVMDFDLKLTDGLNKGEKSEKTPTLRIGSFDADAKTATAVEIDKAKYSVGDDWVHARIIVSNSTGAKLYIGGTEVAGAANTDVKALNTIGLYSTDPTQCGDGAMADLVGNSQYDADGTLNDAAKPTKSAIADIDNVIIYNEAAGVATGTSQAPGAQSQTGGATPKPVATTVPIGTAPTLAISTEKFIDKDSIEVYNFDNLNPVKWSLGTEEQNVEAINGLNIHIGARSNGGTVSTFASIAKGDSDNVLQMQAGQYAHAGRAPRLNVKTSMEEAFNSGKTLAMSFAVKLSVPDEYKDNADANPKLYFLKNANQAGDDGAGAYNMVAAVLTTNPDETIMRGETDVISAYVAPDEWHYVTLVVSPNGSGATHRLYVDGGDEPAVKCDYVATGEAATYMSDLPMLSPQSRAAKIDGSDVNPEYGIVSIDNLMVYNGEPSEPKRMCATLGEAPEVPTPTPTVEPIPDVTLAVNETTGKATLTSDINAKVLLVQAEYTAGGASLNKIKKFEPVTLVAGVAQEVALGELVTNDKIMVWNSAKGMRPVAEMHTVVGGAAQETPAPTMTLAPTATPTAAPTAEPTATPGAVTDPTATPGAVTDPTATPGAVTDPTATPGVVTDPTATPAPTATATPDPTATPEPTATPAPKSAVTVAAATNGTVKIMDGETELDATALAAVEAGKELTVVGTPNAGYAVKTITVAPTNAESTTTVAVANGKFTMPAEAVTVTVEFEYEGKFTIVPDATYVTLENNQTADAKDVNNIGKTPVLSGGAKLNGGKLVSSDARYTDNSLALIFSVDASDYIGKIESAKLKFNATTQGGNNTYFRWWGKFANYIDFDTVGEAGITGANLETLGGTATQIHDEGNNQWTYGTTKNQTNAIEIDITDALKGITTGKVTMYLTTGTGRATEIADLKIDVQASETAKELATVNVHTVYADENGTITVGENKYTEFGTAKTQVMYAGDKYTAGHTAVIDNKNAETAPAKYTYASGDEEITAVAGNNDIYLVYTRELYSVVTFTAKVGETATAGVPIVVTKGADAVGTFTTAAAGENTTEGVISTKLLPGTYSYTVAATANYSEITDGTFTVGTAGEAVPVAVNLQANTKASATLKVVYTTDGTAEGKVGEVTVYNADANKFEDDVVSADDLASYRIVSKIANAEGLYGLYTYTSGGDQAVTLAGGENIVYITVTASSDTRLFNVYEDFEDGVNKFIDASRTSVYVEDNTVVNSKVQAFKRAGNAQNGYGLASFALPTTLNKAKTTVEFDAYIDGSNSREIISIRAVEGGTTAETTGCSKVTYGSKGVMFNMGQTWSQTALLQGATVDPGLGKWVHVQVIINTTTKKVSYTITEKESGNAVQSATDVAYVDTTTETTNVGYIDVFGGLNNYDKTRIDNIIVINEDAE